MDTDFSSLAARIAADIQDLRGCVIVSRDGLVLGSHPADAEKILRPAWLRFASLGDVEKGFIQFPSELWVYVRRGPYASFAVSNSVTRPGLLLDELEQVLLDAEEARAVRDVGPPAGGEVPRSKPRAPLHPEVKPPAPAPSMADLTTSDTDFVELSAVSQESPEAEVSSEPQDEEPAAPKPPPETIDPGDVDRVALAQEFAQLLGDTGYDDEDQQT